jgi:hypothetical protein
VPPNIAAAHERAGTRLRLARCSVRAAFDSLGTGVTFDDLLAYVERDFHAAALAGVADDLDRLHARVVGLIAGACITVVESDRDSRQARSGSQR